MIAVAPSPARLRVVTISAALGRREVRDLLDPVTDHVPHLLGAPDDDARGSRPGYVARRHNPSAQPVFGRVLDPDAKDERRAVNALHTLLRIPRARHRQPLPGLIR